MSNVHLHLEFATKSRRTTWPSVVFFVMALALFVFVAVQVGRSAYDNTRTARRLAELDEARDSTAKSAPRLPRADPVEIANVRFIQQTSRSLETPWPDLLAALEQAPSYVALLSVDPSAAKRNVTLTAEAANPTAMLDYLQELQNDGRLSGVNLVSHQVQLLTPGTPVRFQLKAGWGGPQ